MIGTRNAAVFPEPMVYKLACRVFSVKLRVGVLITSLSTCNNVMTELNSWHTVLLDRRRNVVARKLNILHHYRVQACVLKLANGSNTDIALLMDIKGGKAVKVSPYKCGV